MTTEIVQRWSQIRGLSEPQAMLELRFLGDILASNKKRSTGMDRSKDMIPNFSIEELGWQ